MCLSSSLIFSYSIVCIPTFYLSIPLVRDPIPWLPQTVLPWCPPPPAVSLYVSVHHRGGVHSQKQVHWVWGKFVFNISKCCQIACASLYFYQWCKRVPVFPSTNTDILFFASLLGVNWYFILFCIFLNTNDVKYLSRDLLTIWVPPLVSTFRLCTFFCWVFCHFLVALQEFLAYFLYQSFVCLRHCKFFLPVC